MYSTKGGTEQQIPLKSAVNVVANEMSTESRQLEMQQNLGSMVALQLAKGLCPSDYHGVFQRRKSCTPKGVVYPREGRNAMARKQGSLGGEMRMRVREHCITKSNKTKRNYTKACTAFDAWRKSAGLSNKAVRSDPRGALIQWRDALIEEGYAASTIHTYIAGAACGLGKIDMTGIARHGTAEDKSKSLGNSERNRIAMERESNADIIQFQKMVGGRRSALTRLRGRDLILDESNQLCIVFYGDKGGKTQRQRVLPVHQDAVRAFFERVAPDQLLFPKIDRDLDIHFLRACCAKEAYLFYEKICSTAEGRAEMRKQLWKRYTDPEVGCKAYLLAKERGDTKRIQRHLNLFWQELAEGRYHLRGANRRVALNRGLPTSYDRLALACVSLFHLSHFRNEVSCKHYLLS